SFSDYRTEMLEGPGWAPYVDYCEVARSRNDYISVFQDWVQFRAAPYAGKAAEVINHVTGLESGRERMERSLEKIFGPIGTPEVAASLAAHYHLASRRWDDDESLDYFRRIAELCEVNGVSLVWVRLPVTRLYHEAASELLPMPEWEALVQRMLDAHPEITLINYHEALFGQSNMFKDSDHLSAEGRAWATTQLAADLRARAILPPVVSISMPGASK
ncbi:MAG: hypothetical protein SGI88_15430, partial [Candidatus Hydrogenedentes bacterium]|nr:hypothetical protein [Candidatus Hydrogenedentota bacterium]